MDERQAQELRQLVRELREPGPAMAFDELEGAHQDGREAGQESAADRIEDFLAKHTENRPVLSPRSAVHYTVSRLRQVMEPFYGQLKDMEVASDPVSQELASVYVNDISRAFHALEHALGAPCVFMNTHGVKVQLTWSAYTGRTGG